MKAWIYPGTVNTFMRPTTNAFTAKKIKAVPHMEAVKISYEYNHPKSDGMDEFVDKYLPDIRRNNPQLSVCVQQSYVPCDTFLEGFYKHARFRVHQMNYRSAEQVLAQFQELADGGRWGRKGVRTFTPFGQYVSVWKVKDYETKGKDVFKVYSRRHPIADDHEQ